MEDFSGCRLSSQNSESCREMSSRWMFMDWRAACCRGIFFYFYFLFFFHNLKHFPSLEPFYFFISFLLSICFAVITTEKKHTYCDSRLREGHTWTFFIAVQCIFSFFSLADGPSRDLTAYKWWSANT